MTQADLPMNLYKANLEFSSRIQQLLQQSGQQWLEMGTRLIGEGLTEANTEVEDLTRSQDWQALAALPGEAFWRQFQQRFGDMQAATQIAVATQTTFARGLQEALREWQKETTRALGGGIAETPVHAAWDDLLKSWQKFLPDVAGVQGSAQPAQRSARRGK